MMSENQWYGSKEHFETEESFEDYKKRKLKEKVKNKFKTPSFDELMRM